MGMNGLYVFLAAGFIYQHKLIYKEYGKHKKVKWVSLYFGHNGCAVSQFNIVGKKLFVSPYLYSVHFDFFFCPFKFGTDYKNGKLFF